MIRTGRVISSEKGQVEVCFERPEACAHCGACAGQKHHTQVKIPGEAPVGSQVDVEMPDQQVVKASLLGYVLPLLMLLLGMAIGSLFFDNEGMWALLGLIFMGISWLILRLAEKKMRRRAIWQPKILAIHEEGDKDHGTEIDEG